MPLVLGVLFEQTKFVALSVHALQSVSDIAVSQVHLYILAKYVYLRHLHEFDSSFHDIRFYTCVTFANDNICDELF